MRIDPYDTEPPLGRYLMCVWGNSPMITDIALDRATRPGSRLPMTLFTRSRKIVVTALLTGIAWLPAAEKSEDATKEPAITEPVVTDHTVTIGGEEISYQATTGYLVLRAEVGEKEKKAEGDGKPGKKADPDGLEDKAKIFFIAYTQVGAEAKDRPVTFAFNGGPGSSSVWLHLGALGPRRVVLTDAGEAPPPPYSLTDNESSWLDRTDLVFIDPVSTGYSRPVPGESPKPYHGVQADIEAAGEFIRLYLTRNERWLSPKFLAGESYGATRAAALSDHLQDKLGLYFNGIMLISAVLNFQTIDFSPGNDLPYVMFLPAYAATAWYHGRLSPERQARSLEEIRAEAEAFAANEYLLALTQGDALPDAEKQRIAARLAELTGLSAESLARQNLRVPSWRFTATLLEDAGRGVGRFDSRITGIRYSPGTEEYDYDPSFEAVLGPFTAGINAYLREELNFETDLPYEILADVSPWNFDGAKNQYLNVAEPLRRAMSRNPYLRVWAASGIFDLATPYYATDYTVRQLLLDPAILGNVTQTFYDAGHMMYTLRSAREQLKSDFVSFLDTTLAEKPIPSAARP